VVTDSRTAHVGEASASNLDEVEDLVTVDAAEMQARKRRQTRWYRIGSVLLTLLLLGIWELLPRAGIMPEIVLPPFTTVAVAFWGLLQEGHFWGHLRVTLNEIFWGFVLGTLFGLFSGILLAVWQPLKRLTYSFVVGFQAIPKIVLAPLFISWFGYGQSSKIVMAIVISFFPVLINTLVGLESVPEDAVRLMRSLRSTRMQVFRKLSLPHAAPLIFAGIKTALTFAVIGAIVGEFVGAQQGLGFLLNAYNFQLRIDRVFSVIAILAGLGAVLYFLLEALDRRLIYWRTDVEQR
jgi:NitT/TauT family transport system permease protein